MHGTFLLVPSRWHGACTDCGAHVEEVMMSTRVTATGVYFDTCGTNGCLPRWTAPRLPDESHPAPPSPLPCHRSPSTPRMRMPMGVAIVTLGIALMTRARGYAENDKGRYESEQGTLLFGLQIQDL